MADAAPPSVKALMSCPPGMMPTVMTSDTNDTSFTPPSTTISTHGIVKFVMSSLHNVAPNPIKPTDPGLSVGFGQTACLQFDKAGSFSFMCSAHGFVGTIVVQ